MGVGATGGYLCYRYELRDMIPIAIIISNACVILLTLLEKALFHGTGHDEGGRFLLFSLIILAVVSMAVFLLRHIAAKMAGEAGRHGT